MDLETENRIAAILLKEAAELRRQAERDGVHVYLQKPKARGRPNSRFLTATVRGVQQANRAVEVNEMWRVRQKEIELDDRLKGRSRHEHSSSSKHREISCPVNDNTMASCSSSKREPGYNSGEDEGLRDDEVEEFLNSRVKRGRGAVGSRMDETGPYLPCSPEHKENLSTSSALREERIVLGPEKPSSLKSYESSEEELDRDRQKKKKARRDGSRSSDKKHSKKHKSKERSKDKRKSSKERRKH